MNRIKKIRPAICTLILIAVCAIGMLALSGCGGGESCTNHDFEITTKGASCEDGAVAEKVCKICGFREQEKLPVAGHDYGEWKILQEPSCRNVGEKVRYCKNCSADERQEISMTSHVIDQWAINTEPTAEAVGRASGRCTVDACGEYVYVDLPVLSETDYTVEVIDSESKIYTLKTGEYKFDFLISNYSFNEVYDYSNNVYGELVGYAVWLKAAATNTTEKLVLPSTYNGYPVVSIYKESFQNMSHVKEVVIPEGIKTIGSGAFDNCPNLEKVTLPSSIEEIGYNYYSDYDNCFGYQVDIYYNGTVEDWCNIKIYETTPFAYTTLCFENIYFIDEDGQYEALTEITVPDSVTSIGDYQFYNFSTLTKVNLHSNITSIGNSAFSLSGLTSFNMPNSVTSVGEKVFNNCENLETITLSENIEAIESQAFAGCTSLKTISIPVKVKTLASSAFSDCTSLAYVEIKADSALQKIDGGAFSGCTSLTSLILPDTLQSVGSGAIEYQCKTVYYMGNTNAFDYIEGNNHITVNGADVLYYSERAPMDREHTYWRFDENGLIAAWVMGNTVDGNKYNYSRTETTVTEEYWRTLKYAQEQGMLEMMFSEDVLGAELAQKQIEMITGSSTKEEYEQKLCAFSAEEGQGSSYVFENGQVTVTVKGQVIAATDYVEIDNVIYIANGEPLCYVDAENNCIYELNETENNSVWHYFELSEEI